jgi:dienelactone hydrolase
MRHWLPALGLLAAAAPVLAQRPATAPPPRPVLSRGERMIHDYFCRQAKQIADGCLADLSTREDWERRRPELRRQFLEMMGLWPLPPRTDLKAAVTGKVEADGFTVEKVVFQSRPGLYVTADLYLPQPAGASPATRKFPAILYVCGHANVVEKGVSFGSKAHYQYHPAWFAAHGYACLILDTLELSELPGVHHGTYRYGMWWWQARGYTPAGVELWNAIRALDYLETRPEVDASRIGVTGRSGGGATTWWVAAADDRPRAFAPVAGITDLPSHVCDGSPGRYKTGVVAGHCDCMYFVNTYRWDFPLVAALAAPRPVLLGNSDADDIFPAPGYRRIAEKVRKVYALYGAEEKFQLLETQGPHRDTPELLAGINGWMNRWLKDDPDAAAAADLTRKVTPHQLQVLDKAPADALNDHIHETFVKRAADEFPAADAVTKEWWAGHRDRLLADLKAKVFAGWPAEPPPPDWRRGASAAHGGVRLVGIDFTSEAGVELRLFVLTARGVRRPETVVLVVLDERGWEEWCRGLGPEFAEVLQLDRGPKRDDEAFARTLAALRADKVAVAAVAPRGVGPTRWADPGTPTDTHIRRRFALIGQTLDGQRVWDARRAVAVVRSIPGFRDAKLRLRGEREAAGVALYAGLFEPAVSAFDLGHLPPSHRNGPTFLNVLRVLDAPQAVALAAPREVNLHGVAAADRKAWDWPLRVQAVTGGKGLTVRVVGE